MPDMNKKTILVVDDDHEIVRAITITLEREGYHVLNAYDGLQALDCVTSREVHLIIIDVMMPKLDGLSAVMKIREKKNLPIIILSAKGEDSDKILGLSMGADDYISKPFNPMELVARVKSQLRRYTDLGDINTRSDNVIVNGRLTFKLDEHVLYADGEPVKLTATETKIVELPETLSFSTLNDWTQQAEKGSEYYMIKEYPKASAVMNELSAFLDFDEKTARFDTPECVQLLENMYDFAFAPDSDYTTSGSDNFSDYFAVYNSVPSPSLAFPVGYPKETVNDPKPFALENGDVLLEKFCTLAIPTESKNAENAWTYIDFVTGDLTEYIDNVTAWSYSINRAYDRNLTVLMLQRQFNFTEEEAESALENFDAIMEKYNAIPTIDDRLYASLYKTVNAYLTADKAPAEETAAKLQASAEQYFAE